MAIEGSDSSSWFSVTWSLAIEEQFYLLLPLIIRITPFHRLPSILFLIIISAPIFRLCLYFLHPDPAYPNYILTFSRIDTLLIGVMCAYHLRQKGVKQYLEGKTKKLYHILLVLVSGVAILILFSGQSTTLGMMSWGYTWVGLIYACILMIALTEKNGIITSITRHVLLQKLGHIAYGVYIIHTPILTLLHALILDQNIQIQNGYDVVLSFIAIPLTLIIAQLSWIHFEKPIVSLGHTSKYT